MNGYQTLKQFNRFAGENISLIKKALTSAAGVGGGLIPQSLEKEITNLIIRLSPELALMQMKKISGNYHEFNQLTALPAANGSMGENATTPTTNSQTTRTGVTLKVFRRKGAVTNFLQDTSGEYIDAAACEMENQLTAQIYDLINVILYGNAGANTYEFNGLDSIIGTYYNVASPANRINEVRFGATKTNLKFLDTAIDTTNRKGAGKHKNRVFVMSPEMLSFVSQTLTNVRLNQGLVGTMSQVEINGGWRLNAYRDIPIVESTSTRPIITMGALTPATAAAGGVIADNTHYFKVSAVTLDGESLAAATSQITAGGNTSTVTLTFAAVANAFRYKVYTSTTQHAEKLIKVIAAKTYDGSGTQTGDVTSVTLTTVARDTTSVPLWMSNDIALEQDTGHDVPEIVFLWDLDPVQGLGKLVYTNQGGSAFDGLITTTPLAQTDDFLPFLVKSYMALTPAADFTSYMIRGARTY
jgi:hypothetical protein